MSDIVGMSMRASGVITEHTTDEEEPIFNDQPKK